MDLIGNLQKKKPRAFESSHAQASSSLIVFPRPPAQTGASRSLCKFPGSSHADRLGCSSASWAHLGPSPKRSSAYGFEGVQGEDSMESTLPWLNDDLL